MFDKNMQSLKHHYPFIHNKIIKIDHHRDIYRNALSKNGMPNLLLESNTYLHSKYDPAKEAKNWIDGFEVEKEDTILIVGLGLGYYVKFLIEKYFNKNIIIIEPDINIFIQALKVHDLSSYFNKDNIVLFVDIDIYSTENIMAEYLYENKIQKMYLTEMPIYRKLYKSYIQDIYKTISNTVSKIRGNLATEILSSQMWLNNTIRNLQNTLNYPTINDNVNGLFKDVPIVIVSAGPSLEQNMHYLCDIYDKALIIAVGSAINILESHNITPHIIIGVDGKEFEARIFSKLQNHTPLMIYANAIHYNALKAYKGNKAWILVNTETSMRYICKKLSINAKVFNSGPSVANIALQIACWFGSPAIMFIGQDLAYTEDKRYASGNAHSDEELSVFEKNSKYIKTKDIYGEDIYTKADFIAMRNWFQDYVNICSKSEGIYNCTEGGLDIKGIPNLTFKDAINQFCKCRVNIDEKIKKIIEKPVNLSKEAFEKLVEEYKEQINEGFELSKLRIKLIEDIIEKNTDDVFERNLDEIQQIGNTLKNIEAYDVLIENTGKRFIQANTIAFQNKYNNESESGIKRKTILLGLMQEYKYIHASLEIAKLAFEGEDIKYSC